MTVQIYDPTIEVKGRHIDFVPRPKSLAGLRVGLVDNSKFNSDQLLERIAKLLECPTIARIGRCQQRGFGSCATSKQHIREIKKT